MLPSERAIALRIRLHPSRQLMLLLGAGHAGAAASSWAAPIPWWLSLALSLAICASLVFGLRFHAWRSAPGALIGFELRRDGSGAIEDRRGRWREVTVLGSSFVSPLLTVVNLRLAGARGRRSLVVAPDALGVDEFRRLRVWLRWRDVVAGPGQADGDGRVNNYADT